MNNLSKKIFIETSVFLAFIDRSDGNHQKAVKVFHHLAENDYIVFTSYINITDSYAAISRDMGHSLAISFLDAMLKSNIHLIFPQRSDLISASKVIKSNPRRQLPLRQSLSVVLMHKRGINEVATLLSWHGIFGTEIIPLLSDN